MSHTILTREVAVAARFILQEEIVAFPTETVYGLGAHAFSETALHRIFVAKNRPPDNPLILHIAETEQLYEIAGVVTETAQALLTVFWPGPLTLVLPKAAAVPLLATAGLATVGIRLPSHPTAREFLRVCGVPVAAPSANRSGRPSPTTWQAVRQDLDGRIACLLQGEQTAIGLESTVVDCTGRVPVVLRAGAITLEQLRAVLPATVPLMPDDVHAPAKSPGLRHQHYAPRARVSLVSQPPANPSVTEAYIGLTEPSSGFAQQMVCHDTDEYAHELFAFFRACDAVGITTIYCQIVPQTGLGVALMDRMRRAAAG